MSTLGCGARMATPPLDVELWGCDMRSEAGACEVLGPSELTVVIPAVTSTFAVGGSALARVLSERANGATHAVTASVAGTGILWVRADGRAVRLSVVRLDPDDRRGRLLRSLRAADYGEVESLARRIDGDGTAEERAYAVSARARVAIRAGQYAASAELFEAAAAQLAARGRKRDAARDLAALAWIHSHRWAQSSTAREVLARGWALDPPAEGRAALDHVKALVLADAGDVRGAIQLFRQIQAEAGLAHALEVQRRAWLGESSVLGAIGRLPELIELADARRTEAPLTLCETAEFANFVADAVWRAAELGRVDAAQLAYGRAAAERAADGGCRELDHASIGALNAGLLALSANEVPAARAWLDRVRSGPVPPAIRVYVHELEARVASATGQHARALTRYTETVERAQLTQALDDEWLGQAGVARMAWIGGDRERALAAGERAHQLSDRLLRRVAFGAAKGTYAQTLAQVSNEHVERLVAAQNVGRALGVVREVQARALRQVVTSAHLSAGGDVHRDALEHYRTLRAELDGTRVRDWELPLETLRELAPARAAAELKADRALEAALADVDFTVDCALEPRRDELVLVLHEARGQRYLFAVGAGEARLYELDVGRGLAPLDAVLARVSRVRIVEPGTASIDLAQLPWRGAPLLRQRIITYGLDLCRGEGRPFSVQPVVLLVEDPRGDLGSALVEDQAVREVGFSLDVLVRQAAQTANVIDRLRSGRFDIFHFAGHAGYGGPDGWGSALDLAGDNHLTVLDTLMLDRVPARVLLPACESGVTDTLSAARTLGIGQAFVVAGASEVLVATAPVDDALAARLTARLYQDLARGHDLPRALHDARLALVADRPDDRVALQAYRVIVP